MSRAATLAGYLVVVCAAVLLQLVAWRARRTGRVHRSSTLGDFVAVLTQRPITRWPLLAGWLWLGWHLFVRVHWR